LFNTMPTSIVFKMRFHLPDVLPSHRLLVGLSDKLIAVDRMHVFKEWGHCLDRDGLLRPDFVLQWFNNGEFNLQKYKTRERGRRTHV